MLEERKAMKVYLLYRENDCVFADSVIGAYEDQHDALTQVMYAIMKDAPWLTHDGMSDEEIGDALSKYNEDNDDNLLILLEQRIWKARRTNERKRARKVKTYHISRHYDGNISYDIKASSEKEALEKFDKLVAEMDVTKFYNEAGIVDGDTEVDEESEQAK